MSPQGEAPDQAGTRPGMAAQYRRIMKTGQNAGRLAHGAGPGASADDQTEGVGAGPLESPAELSEPDLSNGGIKNRVDFVQAELRTIVNTHLGGDPALLALADVIAARGDRALRAVRDDDDEELADNPEILAGLEAIVRLDGSRPTFMIRDGEVDESSSPVGTWGPTLAASAGTLKRAIDCVGRIDLPSSLFGFEGTGFMIHERLILTNLHVLQVVARKGADGSWTIRQGAAIDFGHEFRGQETLNRRALKRVVFAGPKKIEGVNHTNLDVALIELEQPAASAPPPQPALAFDVAPDWPQFDLPVFTIGYPASPNRAGLNETELSLLETLFKSTFGCKRLAPGLILDPQQTDVPWTTGHDATTLGGNSGSLVIVVGREHAAAGLHYGGRRGEPRENWGHILGRVLDSTDGRSDMKLRDHLREFGVEPIDRVGGARF